jgi:hypothetical protein
MLTVLPKPKQEHGCKTYRSLDNAENEAKHHHAAVIVCQERQKTNKRPSEGEACHD